MKQPLWKLLHCCFTNLLCLVNYLLFTFIVVQFTRNVLSFLSVFKPIVYCNFTNKIFMFTEL